MSEFSNPFAGLEGGQEDSQFQSGDGGNAATGDPKLEELQAKVRELELSSAADRARAEQAALQAAQAYHAQQQVAWQQQQQMAAAPTEFSMGQGFDADAFLEDPERATEELEIMGTALQQEVNGRVAPVEQALQAGAQQLNTIHQTLHAQAVDKERSLYGDRGWGDFEEDYQSLRQKFYAAGQLPRLESMLDAGEIDQLLVLERHQSNKPLAHSERRAMSPPPTIGATGPLDPTVAKGNLKQDQGAFLRSWGLDPSGVDLNKPEFQHLKSELGGAG